MNRFYVRPVGLRPDFRLVLAFIWGNADCDSDGNSHPASCREWTELYAQNRGQPDQVFDINPVSEEPLILEVRSRVACLAAAVAYLLATTTRSEVSEAPDGPPVSSDSLGSQLGGFDIAAAWKRYLSSPFHDATLDDPYPNRRIKSS